MISPKPSPFQNSCARQTVATIVLRSAATCDARCEPGDAKCNMHFFSIPIFSVPFAFSSSICHFVLCIFPLFQFHPHLHSPPSCRVPTNWKRFHFIFIHLLRLSAFAYKSTATTATPSTSEIVFTVWQWLRRQYNFIANFCTLCRRRRQFRIFHICISHFLLVLLSLLLLCFFHRWPTLQHIHCTRIKRISALMTNARCPWLSNTA